MIAITFALPAESSDFVGLLETPSLNSREGVENIRGRLHGKLVAVIHTGVGKMICRQRMEVMLRREKFEYLISAGFAGEPDRKSTRLNSSHRCISYAVFCLKKKKRKL